MCWVNETMQETLRHSKYTHVCERNKHAVIALQWNMIKMNLYNLNHGFEQKFFGEKIIWLYMYSAKILNIFNSTF